MYLVIKYYEIFLGNDRVFYFLKDFFKFILFMYIYMWIFI